MGWHATSRAEDFADVPSTPSGDIVADIDRMLNLLGGAGMDRVIVVDLSPPGIPASVVRVIVPGLEAWSVHRGRLGRRAAQAWNAAVADVSGPRI